MPHISRQELDFKTKKQIIDTFEMVLGKMKKDEVSQFLYSILSETERIMLAKRLAIAILISSGLDQTKITRALGVTAETVHRVELTMLKRPRGFEVANKKIKTDALIQEMKKSLLKLASYSMKAAGGRVDPF